MDEKDIGVGRWTYIVVDAMNKRGVCVFTEYLHHDFGEGGDESQPD